MTTEIMVLNGVFQHWPTAFDDFDATIL